MSKRQTPSSEGELRCRLAQPPRATHRHRLDGVVLAAVAVLALPACRVRSLLEPGTSRVDAAHGAVVAAAAGAAGLVVRDDAGGTGTIDSVLAGPASASTQHSFFNPPHLLLISGFVPETSGSKLSDALSESLEQLSVELVSLGPGALVTSLESLSTLRWGADWPLIGCDVQVSQGFGVQVRLPGVLGVRRAYEALWGPSSLVARPLEQSWPASEAPASGPVAVLMQWQQPEEAPGRVPAASTSQYLATGMWAGAASGVGASIPSSSNAAGATPTGAKAKPVATAVPQAGPNGAVVALGADAVFDAQAAAAAAYDALERGGPSAAVRRGVSAGQRRGRGEGLVAVLAQGRGAIRTSRAGQWAATASVRATLDASLSGASHVAPRRAPSSEPVDSPAAGSDRLPSEPRGEPPEPSAPSRTEPPSAASSSVPRQPAPPAATRLPASRPPAPAPATTASGQR